MKLTRGTSRVLFLLGLSLPLLALVTMSWLVHQTTGQFQNSFYKVVHVYKVLNLVQQTQFHLLDAETERRGYLLTGSEEYLGSYGKAMSSLHVDVQELQKLAHDSAGQQTNILELQELITTRLGINPDNMVGRTNLHDALAIALTNQGKTLMEQMGRVLFRMSQEEEYTLSISQQRAEADAISSQLTSVVLIGTVGMVLIFIVIILWRLEKLQQMVTICAWTGRVKHEGQWLRLDEYLHRRFGLSVSHGLSKEAEAQIASEIRESQRPGPEQRAGGTNAA
jgi:CHASE3 domain sensor protein